MKSIIAFLISAFILFTSQYSYSQIDSNSYCGSVFTSGRDESALFLKAPTSNFE